MAKTATATKNVAASPEEDICDSDWCEIRNSPIHGRGLFATRDIPEGMRIIEYVGEKITKAESNRRGWAQFERAQQTGEAGVYLFTLNKRHDIDGDVPWNAARLINHSCDPNCESQIIRGRIWIIALREIRKGEELFFNYGFDLECYEDHPCGCGSRRCVGYIAGEEYWKELGKILKKKEKLAAKAREKEFKKAEKRRREKKGKK